MSNLTIKLLFIAGIVAVSLFVTFPLDEKINLGLDLQGGSHIKIQVDTDSAVRFDLDQTRNRLGARFDDQAITYGSIAVTDDRKIEIRGVASADEQRVGQELRSYLPGWDTRKSAGVYEISLPAGAVDTIIESAVDQALMTLQKRVDSLGVTEPTIQKHGQAGDRILIEMPGVQDLERIKEILKQVALLEWKKVSYPDGIPHERFMPGSTPEETTAMFGGVLPDDTHLVVEPAGNGPGLDAWWPLKRVASVSGSDIATASPGYGQLGEPIVNFQLTGDAGRRFEVATREYVRKRMAIVLTNNERAEVISAPVIQGVIRDQGSIFGSFTEDEARTLSLQLRSGALPANLSIIEEWTIGPSLGKDSIRKGLVSGVAGFVGVMIFMLVYYRLSGVNAVVALVLNILLVFAGLAVLPLLFAGQGQGAATLTLPGIAGMILTVGMAVDNNVLIFERIREELRRGKTVRAAVDQGFSRAFQTILDCNVTTLVAAAFLYTAGSGPVRGFSITLGIGLLASMFTAVFVSRQLFEVALSRRPKAESLSI